MRIVIAGGTGFLGSPLAEVYAEEGHDVRVLTRSLRRRRGAARSRHRQARHHAGRLEPDGASRPLGDASLDDADAVDQPRGRVDRRRRAGRRSARRSCATAGSSRRGAWRRRSSAAATPPRVFISASGVGYYGAVGRRAEDRRLTGRQRLPRAPRARTGKRKRARRSAPAPASCCCAPASCSRESAARCREMMRAVPLLRRRPDRLRPAVHVVDPPARRRRDGALDRRDAGGRRPGQRHGAAPGDEPRVRARARPRAAPAEPRAGAAPSR